MARLAPWLISIVLIGCTTPLLVGEECTDSADCDVGLSCFGVDRTATRSVCMADCDDTMQRLCDGGEVCIPASTMGVPRDAEVCFLGGPTPVGSPCVDTSDCTRGALCVCVGTLSSCTDGTGPNYCYRACSTDDDTTCLSTDVCEGLEGMGTKGYCAPMPMM